MALRPRHGALLAGALSMLFTLYVALLPGLHFAYRSPSRGSAPALPLLRDKLEAVALSQLAGPSRVDRLS